MSNKIKFEFDCDEVFEGIKQGVIRELEMSDFSDARTVAIKDAIKEIKREIQLSYHDIDQLKTEIKNEIKDKVFDNIINEVKDRYLTQFNEYVKKELTKNQDRLEVLEKEIIESTSEELYSDLYRSIRENITQKLNNVLNTIGGNRINIGDDSQGISKEEYKRLIERDTKLSALECAGVDNWEGYGIAMEMVED